MTAKACAYRECTQCKDKSVDVHISSPSLPTSLYSWNNRQEDRQKSSRDGANETITVKMVVKERVHCSVEDLAVLFLKEMVPMTRHIFNIDYQYETMRSLKNSLSVNECILHMDFSENYLCKYGQEIQQVHFGASHRQVSLHTSVAYVPVPSMMAQVDVPIANTTQMSFCTISNCLRHDPP